MTIAQYKRRIDSKLDEARVLVDQNGGYPDGSAQSILWNCSMLSVSTDIHNIVNACQKEYGFMAAEEVRKYADTVNLQLFKLWGNVVSPF